MHILTNHHAWKDGDHQINWDDVDIIDRAQGMTERRVKEAIYIGLEAIFGIFWHFLFFFCFLFSPEDGSSMAVETCWLFIKKIV